jgi:glycosyltransferase involved in cell wall biosynthesis
MNISLVTEASAAGVGNHVIQLAAGLLALDHRVDLAYSPLRMDGAFRAGLDLLRSRARFTSYSLPVHRNPHISDLSAMRTVRARSVLSKPFDIVHCHSTKAGLIGRLGMAGTGVRLVYTPHAMLTLDPDLSRVKRAIVGKMERLLGAIGDAVIAVSTEEKAHAISIGISKRKLFVVPNGISLLPSFRMRETRERIRAAAGLKGTDICIGFVGRLVPQKAPANLLRAFALLPRHTSTSPHLLMVGTGPLLPTLQELARTLQIADRVTWLGERDGRTTMSAFDLFALPSDYEGLPYVVLEAMSLGLPVLSTAVGGISSLVKEDRNGHVVPVQRPDLLASAMEAIAFDFKKRSKMGLESARLVQDFSSDKMVQNTLNVYQAVRRSNPVAPIGITPSPLPEIESNSKSF